MLASDAASGSRPVDGGVEVSVKLDAEVVRSRNAAMPVAEPERDRMRTVPTEACRRNATGLSERAVPVNVRRFRRFALSRSVSEQQTEQTSKVGVQEVDVDMSITGWLHGECEVSVGLHLD